MTWSGNPIAKRLGIDVPLIQAPMAAVSTPAMAAAVSNAGGLGMLASAMLTPDGFAEAMASVRQTTNKPFGVNFFVHDPPEVDPEREAKLRERLAPYYDELGIDQPGELPIAPRFDNAMLKAVVETTPAVVTFHFGLPERGELDAVKATGAAILSSATTVAEAKRLEAGGVDAIIAQGYEAGGHRGTFASAFEDAQVGTFALVPQVVDAVSVPVIAAGGIGDGRGIAAALALGADAVQIGTAFMRCPEAATSDLQRKALATASDAGTRVTRALTGRPARALANRYVREMGDYDETNLPDYPLIRGLAGPLGAAAAETGSDDFSTMWSGQAAALGRELPAAELVNSLMNEAKAVLETLTDSRPARDARVP